MAKKDSNVLKMAVIAGASYALKHMEKNPKATDSQTMQYVTENMEKIIRELDKD